MTANTFKRRIYEYLPWGLSIIIIIGLGALILFRRK